MDTPNQAPCTAPRQAWRTGTRRVPGPALDSVVGSRLATGGAIVAPKKCIMQPHPGRRGDPVWLPEVRRCFGVKVVEDPNWKRWVPAPEPYTLPVYDGPSAVPAQDSSGGSHRLREG